MKIEIRRAEPGDYKAAQQVHAQPKALHGTLQLPFPSEEMWKKRLEGHADEKYALVACVKGELVGMGGLDLFPKSPRRRHGAHASAHRRRRQLAESLTARAHRLHR